MDKLKRFWNTRAGKVVVIVGVAIVMIIILSVLLAPTDQVNQMARTLQDSENPVVQGDVKVTTQETLKTIGGQETRLENQINDEETSRANWEMQQKQEVDKFKQEIMAALKNQNGELRKELSQIKEQQALEKHKYSQARSKSLSFMINNDQANKNVLDDSSMTWLHDSSHSVQEKKSDALPTDSVLHANSAQKQPKSIPYYTIPANTALVNIHPLQPLIGVIPTDGTVVDPETVLFSVGRKGLLANDWTLPSAIKGVQGLATCTGVFNFNHSAVKCSITSITFIFTDGRISTVTGSNENPLGKLTDHFGNDYIPGEYYGNALYAAGGNAFFGGVQGWGGAFANSQVQTQSNAAGTFSTTTFKNADNYAAGLAMQSAGQSMNNWWQKLLKSTTDYVLVRNWDNSTHKLLLLNAVITSPISINYDPTARKVRYQHETSSNNNSLD